MISCVTVTYGRVHFLNEAIGCFLAQDYGGPCELVVLNTCPQQVLFPGTLPESVRFVNLSHRPKSLGEARNMAIDYAKGDFIVTWDDDDIALPHHLATFAAHMGSDKHWLWMDQQYHADGDVVRGISPGTCPLFAFSKQAWEGAGKYPNLTVGEDRSFISAVTQNFSGVKIPLSYDGDITYIYRWGQGVYHASGEGDDSPAKTPAHVRIGRDLEMRMRRKLEPTGNVVFTTKPEGKHPVELVPKTKLDWVSRAQAYLIKSAVLTKHQKEATCLVELGRYGDIINILPIAKHLCETEGKPPFLMVSREFSPLLSGCSYVIPHPVDIPFHDLDAGMKLANETYKRVIRCQVYGKQHKQERATESYNKESWREAGFLDQFDNPAWKLVFDQRNAAREEAVAKKLYRSARPKILTNLTSGLSSPFSGGPKLLVDIKLKFSSTYEVVDVGRLRLEKIYDLLGVIDRADLLLTIDTSLLHLAAASSTPVVALVNDLPWLGTVPRCNCVERIPYSDATADNVINAIQKALGLKTDVQAPVKFNRPDKNVTAIFHATERHKELDPKEVLRKTVAWKSWDKLYANGMVPCHLWKYRRDARGIGDKRALPYFKDVLRPAIKMARPTDIVLWTNDDIVLHPHIDELLRQHIAEHQVCTSHRRDFDSEMPSLDCPVEMFARVGKPHMGRDLMAATRQWWERHWEEIPDFILGASDFDLCLACLVRLQWKVESNRQNLEEIISPAELPPGYVGHICHKPKWFEPSNVNSAPSQLHNRRLFKAWAEKYLPSLHFHPSMTI